MNGRCVCSLQVREAHSEYQLRRDARTQIGRCRESRCRMLRRSTVDGHQHQGVHATRTGEGGASGGGGGGGGGVHRAREFQRPAKRRGRREVV